ncbi:MAG TPA: hypothetical protein VJV79_07515 [Polyangiaceae bacterium]|nr:hypothetical protein [Polyangiaceae bacterium]
MLLEFPAIKLDPPSLPRAKFIRALDIGVVLADFRTPLVGNVQASMLGAIQQQVVAVDAQIAASFSSVDWGDDVDYGPEFSVPTPDLRNTAKAFVERLAHASIDCFGRPIPIPEVSPAADGSIDLHWGDGQRVSSCSEFERLGIWLLTLEETAAALASRARSRSISKTNSWRPGCYRIADEIQPGADPGHSFSVAMGTEELTQW